MKTNLNLEYFQFEFKTDFFEEKQSQFSMFKTREINHSSPNESLNAEPFAGEHDSLATSVALFWPALSHFAVN